MLVQEKRTFYSSSDYDFLQDIKNNFVSIQEELLGIINKPVAWKTLTFKIFGIDYQPNKDFCPTISSILDKYPFIVTAEFSMLEPHTSIHPHTGFTDKLLRAHLGLLIPEGDVGLKILNDTKKWSNGDLLVFDDSLIHEAWNKTNERRVVFMFDFEPNLDEIAAKDVCREVLSKTNDKHLMTIAPREMWLKWLEKGFFY